jgi:hypothetical protein
VAPNSETKILIAISELKGQLTALTDVVKGTQEKLSDHETRIRAQEEGDSKLKGMGTIVAVIIAVFGTVLANHLWPVSSQSSNTPPAVISPSNPTPNPAPNPNSGTAQSPSAQHTDNQLENTEFSCLTLLCLPAQQTVASVASPTKSTPKVSHPVRKPLQHQVKHPLKSHKPPTKAKQLKKVLHRQLMTLQVAVKRVSVLARNPSSRGVRQFAQQLPPLLVSDLSLQVPSSGSHKALSTPLCPQRQRHGSLVHRRGLRLSLGP